MFGSPMPASQQELSLDAAAAHLLEECRMVLPGIQALLGFQLIAVFNAGFSEKLSTGEQQLHLVAIVSMALATILVMSPAALHRQREPERVSRRFIQISSRLLMAGMVPLALGTTIDVYLIAGIIVGPVAAPVVAALLVILFVALWVVLPRIARLEGR